MKIRKVSGLDNHQIEKLLCGMLGCLASFDGDTERLREIFYEIALNDDIWNRLTNAIHGLDTGNYQQVETALKGKKQ